MKLVHLKNTFRGLIGANILLPLAEHKEGRDFRSKAGKVREMINDTFENRQWNAWFRLKNVIKDANSEIPYYRNLFKSIGFDPESLDRDAKYFLDIPYLTKDIIREQGANLYHKDHASMRLHIMKTGGSTGASAHIAYDNIAADWSSAITRQCRTEIGHKPRHSEVHFASKMPGEIPKEAIKREAWKCFANNRYNIFYKTFSNHELAQIWSEIKMFSPDMVHSHPSTMYALAQYVAHVNPDTRRHFKVFESSGELLLNKQREKIQSTFHCDVVNRYGLAEAGVIAYQLQRQSPNMRFLEFFAWPETRNDKDAGLATNNIGDVLPDYGTQLEGELVITPLFNSVMPLIRYRTGDELTMRCEENGWIIPNITGRMHDVITINGTRLPTHYVQDSLDQVLGIFQFQIKVSGHKTILKVVPEVGANLDNIENQIKNFWSDGIEVEFITMEQLDKKGHRQKFRYLIED
ncbi:MAG: phenylacetate--CoA ligase family protein [Lentilitoribacter sp.]